MQWPVSTHTYDVQNVEGADGDDVRELKVHRDEHTYHKTRPRLSVKASTYSEASRSRRTTADGVEHEVVK